MTSLIPGSFLSPAGGQFGPRRIIAILTAVAAVGAIWLLVRWAAAPAYVTLFSNLPLDEVGRVSDKLTADGVAFRLAGGGTEVQVPSNDAARARVTLAKDGLPSSGRPGFELFDKPAWGMTDFSQQVTYRRALEGELERSIRSLQGIEEAQVHLALAQTSALRRLERPAEAAVVVKLRPGTALASEAVRGIAYLVANSVEQLSAERVAVLDDAGHILSAPQDDSAGVGLSTRQLEFTRAVEHSIVQKIENLLAGVVGPNASRVQVSAQLNFSRVDRTVETYDPDGQVLQSEQKSETTPGSALAEGELPQSSTVNIYQNSRRIESTSGAVGEILRLTVAVAVDERAGAAATGATGAAAGPSITPESIARIEALVRDAVGVDSARGDRLTVTAVPFQVNLAAAGLVTAEPAAGLMTRALPLAERLARPIFGLLGILLTFVLAGRVLRGTNIRTAATGAAAALASVMPSLELPPLPSPETDPSLMLKRRVTADSEQRPETAARVVRAWLAES
jgi:flagellar M-ring protein FliF